MFVEIVGVRNAILARCPTARDINLELITQVFTGVTSVDKIVYVQFDTPESNPIWGEFTRWSHQPGVYRPFESIVEIRYAKHLLEKEDWLRFVVCKELCHALDADNGMYDVSAIGMDRLAAEFALWTAGKTQPGNLSLGMMLELSAIAAAIELLVPLPERQRIIAERGQPDRDAIVQLAAEYTVPDFFLGLSFQPDMMETVASLMG